MNPIARAVAREVLRNAILDQKIQLYLTPEGAPCVDFCSPIFILFSALIATAEADSKVENNNYEIKIMRGTLSALDQMMADNVYRRINIVSIETGLDCAQALAANLNYERFNKEWNKLVAA
jgi:hypothetical protein